MATAGWKNSRAWHRLAPPALNFATHSKRPLKPQPNAWAIRTLCTELIKSVPCQASLCWRLCESFFIIISTLHPFLHCTPLYPHNPHLISTGYTLHKMCIHSKIEKVCVVCFSATKKLRENCVNLDIKILQQKCVNY